MCKHPFERDPTGKVRWSVKMTKEEKIDCIPFPCGICLHCKINKRRVWTHRILLEQKCHAYSCFVTLTYSDQNIPLKIQYQPKVNVINPLIKKDLQNYIKRLRNRTDIPIRYYAVGEYGDKTWRPHYHIVIFGLSACLHESIIKEAWKKQLKPIGHIHLGQLNKDTAKYITGYIIKKLTKNTDPRLKGLSPEFMLCSRGKEGGIGLPYVKLLASRINTFKYKEDAIIDKLYHEKKPLPLGGYLTRKLSELTNVSEKALNNRFDEYCQTIYGNHLNAEQSYWAKHFKDEEKMLSQEKKYEILQQTKGRIL